VAVKDDRRDVRCSPVEQNAWVQYRLRGVLDGAVRFAAVLMGADTGGSYLAIIIARFTSATIVDGLRRVTRIARSYYCPFTGYRFRWGSLTCAKQKS
jgi:hypothetical protein